MSNKVTFIFDAVNSFSKVARKVNKSTSAIRKNFRGLDRQAKATGRKMGSTAALLSAKFRGLAIAAAGFFGAKQFLTIGSKFQDSIADLAAITGAAGKDLDNLREKTLLMAKTAVVSQAEVATAIKLVASAKPDLLTNLVALTATTKQVLLLKNAAGIDLASAANITAQALNIFGVEASEASKFVNILAAGAKLGSSEITETGEAMLLAGPAARAAGLDFVQLNAAIQTIAKGGIKGSRAGTALNSILGRLRRQGIDFKKLGLEGAFNLVKNALDKVTDSTKRAQLEATIFGEEHSKVGLAILNNTKLLGQYTLSLKGTNIAQEQADIRLATFSSKARKLGVVVSDAMIKTFLRLEPILNKQITQFTNFLEQLDTATIMAFADGLKIIAGAIAFIGKSLAVVLSVLKGIGTIVGEAIASIATLNFGVESNLRDMFSVGGKLFGLFDNAPKMGETLGGNQSSRTDVNVNLNAPEGAIQSVKSATTGKVSGLNVGVNMATAP